MSPVCKGSQEAISSPTGWTGPCVAAALKQCVCLPVVVAAETCYQFIPPAASCEPERADELLWLASEELGTTAVPRVRCTDHSMSRKACRNVLHAAAARECCYRPQHIDRPYAQRGQQLTAAGTTPCCCCQAQLSTGAYQADVLLQLLQHAVCCAMLLCAQQSDTPSSSGGCCRNNKPLLQPPRGIAATAAVAAAPPAAAAATTAAAYAPRRSFFMRVALGSRRPPLGSCDKTQQHAPQHTACVRTVSDRALVCLQVPCLCVDRQGKVCVLGLSCPPQGW